MPDLVLNNNILLTQGSLLVDGLGDIGLNDNRVIYTRQNKSLNTTYVTQVWLPIASGLACLIQDAYYIGRLHRQHAFCTVYTDQARVLCKLQFILCLE